MVALPKVAMLDFVRWISSELEDLQYLPSVNITLRSRHAKNFFMVTGCCLLTLLYVCLSLVYNPYIVSSLVNVQRKLLARLFCIHTNRQKCGWMNSSNSNPMDGWSIKMLLLLIVLVLCQNIVEDLHLQKRWQMPVPETMHSNKLFLKTWPSSVDDFFYLCCHVTLRFYVVLSLRDYLNDDTVGTACAF